MCKYEWHYLYVIFYPAKDYQCYYGARITNIPPDEDIAYFGSAVTYAHYNQTDHADYQSDALKVIIWAKRVIPGKRSRQRLADLEKRMIKQALVESGPELCLNRNYGGIIVMSEEEHKKAAASGGYKSYTERKGIHGMSKRAMKQRLARSIAANAKSYTFLNPVGKSVTFMNLRRFCRDNNLDLREMRRVHARSRRSHLGWRLPPEN